MRKIILSTRHVLLLCLLTVLGYATRAQVPTLTGPDTVCVGVPSVFTASPNVTTGTYTWLANPATTPTSTTNSATITFNSPTTSGNVTVLFPGFNPPPGYASKTVVVIPAPDLTITSNFEVGCQSLSLDSTRKGEEQGGGSTQTMQPDGPCVKVCEYSIVRYYATGATGTFSWNVIGGNIMNDWGDSIEVQWGAPGTSGSVNLHAVTPCANYDKVLCIQVTAKPKASFAVLPDLNPAKDFMTCVKNIIQFKDLSVGSAQSPIVSWYWDFGDGNTSAQQNPTYSYDNPGGYIITLTVKNACNCTDVYKIKVDVSPEKGPDIVCPSVVCEKQKARYTTNVPCGYYEWKVTGGGIVNGGGPGDNYVEVVWGGSDDFGYVSLTTPGCSGICPGTTTIKVPIVRIKADISGPLTICTNKQYEYTLPLWPGTQWNWGVINKPDAVQGTRSDYKLVVNFDKPGTYTIHGTYQNYVTLCGGDAQLKIKVVDPSVIQGDDFACQGDSKSYQLNTGDVADWVLDGPAPQSGTGSTFNASFPLPGTYVLSANGDFCADAITIKVQKLPGIVNTLTGKDTVCLNVPYTYKATNDDPNSVFTWQAVGGTVVPGNGSEVTVIWTGGAMQLKVWRVNVEDPHCSGPVKTMNIIQDIVNPTVIGPNVVCANGYNNYQSSYTKGDTYYWNVTPVSAGGISSGVYAQQSTILWKNVSAPTAATITLVVTKCGKSDTTRYNVTVNPSPLLAFTAAPTTGCPQTPVTFAVTGGAASYNWNIPGVYTGPGPNPLTVAFPNNTTSSAVPYTVTATAVGVAVGTPCPPIGSVSTVINILPGPVAYASTPGPVVLCPGGSALLVGTYTNNVSGLTFQWQQNGTNFGGSTANSTANSAGAYRVIVTASNGCKDTSNVVNIGSSSCSGSGGGCTTPPQQPTLSASVNCNQVTLTPSFNPGATYSWSYSETPGGAGTTSLTFANPGIYTITYRETWPSPYCTMEKSVQVQIGLKPDFYTLVSCGAGNTYNVNFQDRTAYITGWTINNVGWSIAPAGSASPATGTGNSFTSAMQAGQTYTITQTVYYTDPNSVTGSCTITRSFTTPTKPTATIGINVGNANSCSGLTIGFVPNVSLGTSVSSYLWDFGGSGSNGTSRVASPQATFAVSSPTTYNVTLNITDAFGCTTSATTPVTIFPNNLSGRVDGADTICSSGAPVTLTYNSLSGAPVAPYFWNAENPIGPFPPSTYAATRSGAYWVQLFDNHLCRFNSPGVPVMIIQSPKAKITGDVDYCDGDAVKLNGYIGASTSYEWRRNGGPVFSTAPNINDAGLSPGTYTYQLKVTNTDPVSNTVCSDIASTTVTINNLPSPPSITGPVIVDCKTNEMTLTASHGSPGTFTWSNGASGAVNTIFEGGPYRVWYTNSLGCRSHADIYVPQAPEKYFAYFPSGCYEMCKTQIADLYLYGPPAVSFREWDWIRNGGIDMTGYNSFVQPYKVPDFGDYQEQLDNGMCVEKSDIMSISDAKCGQCEGAIKEVRLICDPSVPGRYKLFITLSNPMGQPVSYYLGSNYGAVLPSIGGLGAGGSVTLNIAFNSLVIPPPAVIKIQLLFIGEKGDKCYRSVDVKIPQCSWDPQRPAGEEASEADGKVFTLLDALELYPNPASHQATVSYDFGAHQTGERAIVVYDISGRKVAEQKVTEQKGKWIMQTGTWISGMYLIRMEAEGKTLHVQRLAVTH